MKYGDTFLFFNSYSTSVFVDTNDKLEKKYSSDNYISNMCHTCTDATKIIELLLNLIRTVSAKNILSIIVQIPLRIDIRRARYDNIVFNIIWKINGSSRLIQYFANTDFNTD